MRCSAAFFSVGDRLRGHPDGIPQVWSDDAHAREARELGCRAWYVIVSSRAHYALDFAAEAETIQDLETLTRRTGQVLAPFGVVCLSANLIARPARVVRPGILFGQRWRAWSRYYHRSGFALWDPALRMLAERSRNFTWSEARARFRSVEGERVMDACFDMTGSREGLVVPVRESDGAVLTAAFSGPDLDVSDEARAVMQLVGHYYVTRGRELMLSVALNPTCPLSPRQLECLRWVVAGKTDREIAAILGLSGRTVHHHVEAAKDALGLSKRSQAAMLAWRSGWLS